MGRTALGSALGKIAGVAAFLAGGPALAQPVPEPVVVPVEPSGAKAPAAPAGPAPQPAAPAPKPAPTPKPPAVEPAPLELPREPAKPPSFLHTREEMERLRPKRRPAAGSNLPDPDFVARSSPWVDFSLTSFYLDERVGNFLNFGVQAGGYFFERLRLSARLVAPLEEVRDSRDYYESFSFNSFDSSRNHNVVKSRSMNVMYGASFGLVVSNDKSFVFGPNLGFYRTDVEDYGTAFVLGLPFEWTTARNLRVGFELSLGRVTGGSQRASCITNTSPSMSCGVSSEQRESGTAVLFQYYMGWSLGHL